MHFKHCKKLLVGRNRDRGEHNRTPGGLRCKTHGGWKFSSGVQPPNPPDPHQLALVGHSGQPDVRCRSRHILLYQPATRINFQSKAFSIMVPAVPSYHHHF